SSAWRRLPDLLVDWRGVVDAAVSDESCASLDVAVEREGVARRLSRCVRDGVPEGDDGDRRAVVDTSERVPGGIGCGDRRSCAALHRKAGEHHIVGMKACGLV